MKKTEDLNQEVLKEREVDIEEKAKRVIYDKLGRIATCKQQVTRIQKEIVKHQTEYNKLLEKTPQEIADESEGG